MVLGDPTPQGQQCCRDYGGVGRRRARQTQSPGVSGSKAQKYNATCLFDERDLGSWPLLVSAWARKSASHRLRRHLGGRDDPRAFCRPTRMSFGGCRAWLKSSGLSLSQEVEAGIMAGRRPTHRNCILRRTPTGGEEAVKPMLDPNLASASSVAQPRRAPVLRRNRSAMGGSSCHPAGVAAAPAAGRKEARRSHLAIYSARQLQDSCPNKATVLGPGSPRRLRFGALRRPDTTFPHLPRPHIGRSG